MKTRNPLEVSSSKKNSKIQSVASKLTLTSVDVCPMCHQPMKKMKIGRNQTDAYICMDDRVALPVEDEK